MVEPRVVPRAEHPISRREIDPDALKVLYRLSGANYTAYLVGGGVRDLLIGRRPKDFDIGTSAHPHHVKKLFRNCWIIGRRFRLAHVKFGNKVIEVATFRRLVPPGEEPAPDGAPMPPQEAADGTPEHPGHESPAPDHLIHRDNTFGTPEEDAFRRDFTINALFYVIADFSVIDYVGGLEDLRARLVRSIGDPAVRFREDPVRMMRAVALAARLDFTIDPPSLEAIHVHRREIARSAAPRLLDEYYKILRNGAAERTFRDLARLGLLEPISEELHRGAADPLWRSLTDLDAYRQRFESSPDTLTNAIVLGCLIVPLGLMEIGRHRKAPEVQDVEVSDAEIQAALEGREYLPPTGPRLGQLPLARRDIERLRQVLSLQRRLRDLSANPRAKRALIHRGIFRDALTWMDVHGGSPAVVEHWKALLAEVESAPAPPAEGTPTSSVPSKRRRRRRGRRRSRPAQG